jgi:hypothetical protein
LVPPFRRDYLIRELRFVLQSNTFNAKNSGSSNKPNQHFEVVDTQQFYQTKLSVGGKWAITDGFIPVCSLCPSVQLAAEEIAGINDGTDPIISYSCFRWILPKPMYVESGNGILASFSRIDSLSGGGIGNLNGAAEIAVIGETCPDDYKRPSTSCVPYAQAYSNNNLLASTNQALSIQNPFNDRVLHMQRFIGRYYRDLSALGGGSATPGWFQSNLNGTGSNDAQIGITDSDRFPISGSDGTTRFGRVFDVRTHSLEHRRDLQPKGYFQVKFLNGGNDSNGNPAVYWVSAIGWRDESVS